MVELLARSCRPLGGGGRLLRDSMQIGHISGDFIGYGQLFLSSAGDLMIHLRDVLNGLGDGLQDLACFPGFYHRCLGLGVAVLDTLRRFSCFALQGADHLLDLVRRLLRALRQCAHFVCDHCKAASHFTGPRRLDSSIQRQQIGLLRNAFDHLEHGTDALTLVAQREDDLR